MEMATNRCAIETIFHRLLIAGSKTDIRCPSRRVIHVVTSEKLRYLMATQTKSFSFSQNGKFFASCANHGLVLGTNYSHNIH